MIREWISGKIQIENEVDVKKKKGTSLVRFLLFFLICFLLNQKCFLNYSASSLSRVSLGCTPTVLPVSAPSLNAMKVGTDMTP